MKKPKNRIVANVLFYLNIWIRTFPWGLALIVLTVFLTILAVYEQIRIPQLLIGGMERGDAVETSLRAVFLAFFLMSVCKISLEFCESKLKTRGSRPMIWLYSVPVHEKLFGLPYEQLISSDVQNKLAKLDRLIVQGGDGGPIRFFGIHLANLFVAVTGMAVFSRSIIGIDPLLLLAIALSTLVHLAFGIYAGKYSERNMRERSESEKKEGYILKILADRHYSKDIRLYRLLLPLTALFRRCHDEHGAFLKKEANVQFGTVFVGGLAVFVRDALSYAYLTRQLIAGRLLISEFVFLAALVIQFSAWMNLIVQNANELILFSAQMEQIRDFIDLDTAVLAGTLTADAVSPRPVIEFRHVSYAYPESEWRIFDDFNLTIRAGEKLALVGINGAGKTTLMHLLMGLLEPSEGEILVDGKRQRDFAAGEYFRLFSPVFQDIIVFPESIAVNVAGGRAVDEKMLWSALENAGIADFVRSLPEREATKLVRDSAASAIDLSGGMNQRMLLARALYKDAPINILDEPTAALDPLAESRIYAEFEAMSRGRTSIFISHRLASTRFCDRILLLENGRILEEGTHEELIALNGRYGELYDAQSAYYREEEVC